MAKTLIVRLPQWATRRLDTIASASVRPQSSLVAFALSHALHIAATDPDAFIALSVDGLGAPSTDGRTNLSVTDSTVASLLNRLMTTYMDEYKTPTKAPQAVRAAVLAWLTTASDDELISQVGTPTSLWRVPA